MPAITAKSPGKTILFGEHAVVYGHPAIAVPLPSISLQVSFLGLPEQPAGTVHIRNANTHTEELLSQMSADHPIRAALELTSQSLGLSHIPATEISISSTIPIASGLGSSAALAAAFIRGFSQYLGFHLEDERIDELAFEMEKLQHGTPSGIDNTVIVHQKPIYFVKGRVVEHLKLGQPITLIVADTGVRSLTREVVAEVRERLQTSPEIVTPILEDIGRIARQAREELLHGTPEQIGHLMNENQDRLVELDVSCPELDNLVAAARSAGALGAKLCGSGKGGNMVALVLPDQAETVRDVLLDSGAVTAIIAEIE
ncbi:mevalonate kinase [Pelolinea submarina]|uniref:mevalonate kinase n=1 Tax=Pelolinea submarina TaxID=913107 RepID=A0A347ZSQ9_9CHLR|nr:mevalonate kinase [Pelolinea submarina]REG11087.1 mevalonate kinase [Pelolinea submarina]BBB48340.1 mevalonate kinase [Pelolinea submarina]